MPRQPALHPALLLVLPTIALAASYAYLVMYHGSAWLGSTIVHENGSLTLVETTLYASHALGHVPVVLVFALLTAGTWLCMTGGERPVRSRRIPILAAMVLTCVVIITIAISLSHFGPEDTWAYVAQQRQSPGNDVQGGSWILHLPSTVLLPLLVTPAVWLTRRITGLPVALGARGWPYLATAALVVFAMSSGIGDDPVSLPRMVFADPRYLAHGVREMATFPVIHLPVILATLAWLEPRMTPEEPDRQAGLLALGSLALLLAALASYSVPALRTGIGVMAQHPPFAGDEDLGIAYLLAFHFYEHVLDIVIATPLVVLLVTAAERRA